MSLTPLQSTRAVTKRIIIRFYITSVCVCVAEEAQKKNRAVIPTDKLRQSGMLAAQFFPVSLKKTLIFVALLGMKEWSDPFAKEKPKND